MNAKEFLAKKGVHNLDTKKRYNEVVAWMEEYAALRQPPVSGSLPPLDDETAATPIQDALYATGKFSTDDCSNLADGILQYIKDAKMNIVGGNDR